MDEESSTHPSVLLPPEEIAEARAHVANCAACREFFTAEDRLHTLLRTRAPREKASAALREKVLTIIATERGSSMEELWNWRDIVRIRRAKWALIGLALAVALAGSMWMLHSRGPSESQPLASILIEDHLGNLSSTTEISTSDPDAVKKWFRERVGFAFRLPATSEPKLIGGRLCNLQGRRAALILYRHPQSTVSLFILDGEGVKLSEGQLITLDGKQCMLDARKGYNVVLWKERGLLYGLVSDVQSTELLQLAEKF